MNRDNLIEVDMILTEQDSGHYLRHRTWHANIVLVVAEKDERRDLPVSTFDIFHLHRCRNGHDGDADVAKAWV